MWQDGVNHIQPLEWQSVIFPLESSLATSWEDFPPVIISYLWKNWEETQWPKHHSIVKSLPVFQQIFSFPLFSANFYFQFPYILPSLAISFFGYSMHLCLLASRLLPSFLVMVHHYISWCISSTNTLYHLWVYLCIVIKYKHNGDLLMTTLL